MKQEIEEKERAAKEAAMQTEIEAKRIAAEAKKARQIEKNKLKREQKQQTKKL